MNYMNREDRKNIEKINDALGMHHRTRPYDFKKADDVIEATVMATAEYMDMAHYWMSLVELDEAFDESMEYYDTAAWVNIGLHGSTGLKDTNKAINTLDKTIDAFRKLMESAENRCEEMWNIVFFSSPGDVKKHFFGQFECNDMELVNSALETTFENIFEIEYNGNIESSAYNFGTAVKENIGLLKNLPGNDK